MTATETSDWPYDADRDDPLTALRIPVVSAFADWPYIVAFDAASPERPTTAEAAMLASYLAYYIDYVYTESYKAKLRERPFDIDPAASGVTFHKYESGSWAYRRNSWCEGPRFVPGRGGVPWSLPQVMDRAQAFADVVNPRWIVWKAAHPDVFGASSVEVPGGA